MRTTLDIDEKLMEKARELAETKTKKETVERGLQTLINLARRDKLIEMGGEGYGMDREEFLESRRDE